MAVGFEHLPPGCREAHTRGRHSRRNRKRAAAALTLLSVSILAVLAMQAFGPMEGWRASKMFAPEPVATDWTKEGLLPSIGLEFGPDATRPSGYAGAT